MTKKVSILMPSYNYEDYIKTAIDSVLKQTYTNWELIIIDDGSFDNSVEIIKEYKDKRIFLYAQKNHGVTYTLNKAFKHSKGDYICFLDADDFYHPKKLEKQVKMLNSGYDLVTTQVSAVDSDGNDSDDKFFNLWWNEFDPKIIFGPNIEFKFFNGNYLCKSAVMLKRELYEKYGMFNTKLITSYDLELWIKMLPHIKITRCDKILTYYRWHGLNETITNTSRMKREMLLIYDKYLDSLKISIDKNPQRVRNFATAFSYLIRTQGLLEAYIMLQTLKKCDDCPDDIYDILTDERFLNIIDITIEQKGISYKIIQDGQSEGIKQLDQKENLWEKIRRRLIPLNIRRFLRKLIKK